MSLKNSWAPCLHSFPRSPLRGPECPVGWQACLGSAQPSVHPLLVKQGCFYDQRRRSLPKSQTSPGAQCQEAEIFISKDCYRCGTVLRAAHPSSRLILVTLPDRYGHGYFSWTERKISVHSLSTQKPAHQNLVAVDGRPTLTNLIETEDTR